MKFIVLLLTLSLFTGCERSVDSKIRQKAESDMMKIVNREDCSVIKHKTIGENETVIDCPEAIYTFTN